MTALVIVVVCVLALAALAAGAAESASSAMQAQAAIEASRAAQIAAAGQTAATTTLLVIVVGFVVLTFVMLGVAFYFARKQSKPAGRWAPGPNAGFRRLDEDEAPYPTALPRSNGMSTEQMFAQMMMMQMLQNMRPPQQKQLPRADDYDDFQEW